MFITAGWCHATYDIISCTCIVIGDFICFIVIAMFSLLLFFLINAETTKTMIRNVYLFTFILETGLNSHA